jgi:hypothetical protein
MDRPAEVMQSPDLRDETSRRANVSRVESHWSIKVWVRTA